MHEKGTIMRINKITSTPNAVNFTADKNSKDKHVSAFRTGLTTTVLWFGIGYGSDKVMSKMLGKYVKSDPKSSLIMNGTLSAIFGVADGIRAKIKNKKGG